VATSVIDEMTKRPEFTAWGKAMVQCQKVGRGPEARAPIDETQVIVRNDRGNRHMIFRRTCLLTFQAITGPWRNAIYSRYYCAPEIVQRKDEQAPRQSRRVFCIYLNYIRLMTRMPYSAESSSHDDGNVRIGFKKPRGHAVAQSTARAGKASSSGQKFAR
jgi:hypothetical protein